jgi:hypothetical protein
MINDPIESQQLHLRIRGRNIVTTYCWLNPRADVNDIMATGRE